MRRLAQERSALDAASRVLQSTETGGRQSVSGELRGHKVTFSIASGPGWSVQVKTTRLPLAIDITGRQFTTQGASDLLFGDEGFDKLYFVDAAPPEVAQATLDDELRRRIIALNPDRLSLNPGEVKLTKQYRWYFAEANDISEAIDLAVTLAEGAHKATEAAGVTALQVSDRSGHPFRGEVDTEALKTAIAVRDEHVNAVVVRQGKRWNKRRVTAAVVGIGYLVYIGISLLLS